MGVVIELFVKGDAPLRRGDTRDLKKREKARNKTN